MPVNDARRNENNQGWMFKRRKKDNVNITYKGFGEGPCKKKKKLDDKKSVMYLLLL